MRVGLVCPYSLDVPGGVQNHVLGLARSLTAAGHDVSVLAPGRAVAPWVVSSGGALPVPYNGAVGRVSFGPVVASRVGRWLAGGEFDVVHVHEPLTPSISLHAVRLARTPVVATFHTAQERPRVLAASAALLMPWLDRIDVHLAVSETARRTVHAYLGVTPSVLPNGLDVATFAGPPTRDGRTVLFLGRVDEARKGLSPLLAAWPTVRRRVPEARLLVAGPGRVPALPDGAQSLGEVCEADKADLLRSTDVLVAPNTHGESFGLVITEAMAAGATVLARDLPAFSDVLEAGRHGAMFRRDGLADELVALLRDAPRRHALAGSAAEHVRRFDWSAVTPTLEATYDQLLQTAEMTAVYSS
jgi:phosphatidyl-myo-inositol alpha-mannosyltransferase